MNLCRSCGNDFASTSAFDAHRTGKHAYTHEQGRTLQPPRHDGRRCLTSEEMLTAGMEVDNRGRWRIAPSELQKTFYKQNSSVLSASAT